MYLPGRALLEELCMASSVQRALMSSMGITECSGRKRTNATHQTCSLNCFFFLKSIQPGSHFSFLIFNVTVPLAQHILKITISKTGNQLESASSQEWPNLQSEAQVLLKW